MENMEVMNNEVVVEEAAEVVEATAKIGLGAKIAIGVGVVALGVVLYKKVIKPAIEKKRLANEDSED